MATNTTLTQAQRKYVIERIGRIYKQKEQASREANVIVIKQVKLSNEKRLEALRKGKFKLKPGITEVREHDYIYHILGFEGETERKDEATKHHKVMEKLDELYNSIRDEAMLGDGNKALSLIKKLEDFKVKA